MDFVNFLLDGSPKITKVFLISFAATTVIVWFEVVSPLYIYLNYSLLFKNLQLWRLFTPFLYPGELNISSIVSVIMFFRTSKMLELNIFRGISADYLFFILISMITILIINFYFNSIFLFNSLLYSMTYYWSRKNKRGIIQIFGLLPIRAPYLPWFYIGFSFLLEWEFKSQIMGMLCGHLFFFMKDIFPRIKEVNGLNPLKTPNFIKKISQYLQLNNDVVLMRGDDEGNEEQEDVLLF